MCGGGGELVRCTFAVALGRRAYGFIFSGSGGGVAVRLAGLHTYALPPPRAADCLGDWADADGCAIRHAARRKSVRRGTKSCFVSPTEVWDAYLSARSKRDLRKCFECMTPEKQ